MKEGHPEPPAFMRIMASKGFRPVLTAAALLTVVMADVHAADQPEQVLITADRYGETPLQSATAVSPVYREDLHSGRIRSPDDLARHVANVEVAQPLGNVFPVFVIRGVGLNDYNVNNNPAVGAYRDGVFLSSNVMIPKVLFDLERVEILKGPQGTLYGRNTTGGAINFLSVQPGDSLSGYFDVGYGNYNTVDMQGAIGGPVTKNVGARLAGFAERRFDGYQLDRTTGTRLGEIRTWALRGILTFEPIKDLKFSLMLTGGQDGSDVQRFQHRGVLGPQCEVATKGVWNPQVCFDAFGYHDTDGNKLAGDYSLNPRMSDSNLGGTLTTEWKPGPLTLTSITNAEGYDYIHGNEEDASPQTVVEIHYDSRIRQLSEELLLASQTETELNWIVGAFVGQYRHREHRRADITDAERAFGPLFGSPIVDLPYLQLTKTAAGFADARWQLHPLFRLRGGLRYTFERVSYDGGTVLPLLGNAPIVQVDNHITTGNLSWRLNLAYVPNKDTLIYGQISTGFKSGGFFGGFAFSPAELTPYRPETVTAYEIGAKRQITPVLAVDSAAFVYNYDDLQAIAIGARGAGGTITIPTLTNLPGARIYGGELNVEWEPITDITFRTNVGLLDTKIEGPAFAFGSAGAKGPLFNLSGNQLPRAPHVSLGETFSYTYRLGSFLELVSEINVAFRSKQHMDLNNFPMATQPAYATVDGTLRLVSANGWEVAAWLKNATDVIPYLADGPVGFGERDAVAYGTPRTYGVTTRLTF